MKFFTRCNDPDRVLAHANATLTVVEIDLELPDHAVGDWVQLVDRLASGVRNSYGTFSNSDAAIAAEGPIHLDFGDAVIRWIDAHHPCAAHHPQ